MPSNLEFKTPGLLETLHRLLDLVGVSSIKLIGEVYSPLMEIPARIRGLEQENTGTLILPPSCSCCPADVCLMCLQLNDKEVALAHQKRVSLMLALSAEELQKKLHLKSHPSVPSLATCDTSESDSVSR